MELLRDFARNWQLNMATEAGSMVIVACSGGIDSLALTDLLHRLKETLGIKLVVAHFEHGIRGEESLEDAEFVRDFCRGKHIPCHIAHGDVPGEMARCHESLETTARRLRYDFLYGLRNKYLAENPGTHVYIATAHHQDDQAETVLMHLLRGTGLKGLSGISPKQGCLLRPLLFVPKSVLTEYCMEQGLRPRHDSSNDEADCLRNKIRLELLPLLEREYNPSLRQGLCHLSQLAAQDEAYISQQVETVYVKLVEKVEAGRTMYCQSLLDLPEALRGRLIQKIALELSGKTLPYNQVQGVLQLAEKSQTGTKIELSFGLIAKISYKFIYIIKKTISISENNDTMDIVENYSESQAVAGQDVFQLNVPGKVQLPDGTAIRALLGTKLPDGNIRLDKEPGELYHGLPEIIRTDRLPADTVYGAADALALPLIIRHRQPGDRIRLTHGSRKLKDFLIDSKIPREVRDSLWLIASGEEILWLAGVRRFSQSLVRENTNRVFVLSYMQTMEVIP